MAGGKDYGMKIDTEREREDLMDEHERLTLELDRIEATLAALDIMEAYQKKLNSRVIDVQLGTDENSRVGVCLSSSLSRKP